MSYYLRINGVPSCESSLTHDTGTVCSHSTREAAEKAAHRILAVHGSATIKICPGGCPASYLNDPHNSGYEEGLAHARAMLQTMIEESKADPTGGGSEANLYEHAWAQAIERLPPFEG